MTIVADCTGNDFAAESAAVRCTQLAGVSAESLMIDDGQESSRKSCRCSVTRFSVAGVLVAGLCAAIMCVVRLGPLLLVTREQNILAPLERTDRPIIGILTVPVHADSACATRRRLDEIPGGGGNASEGETSCFSSTYALWLAAAGARVVPLRYDLPAREMDRLMRSVNGILFTGGDVDLRQHGTEYMQSARRMLDHVLDTNRKGTHFPLWGTCMGFETLNLLIGGTKVVEYNKFVGVDHAMLPLRFTAAADDSRLFSAKGSSMSAGLLSSSMREWFQTKNVTVNYHHDGISPAMYESDKNLKKFFNVLATNEDVNGRPFVSAIEARDFPIYGVQFHPERPQFQFHDLFLAKDPLNHRREAVACNAYLAQAFVAEARQNTRKFPTQEEEDAALIDNYSPRGVFSQQSFFFAKP